MKHFWLCSKCNETFTIGYRKGIGVLLMDRIQGVPGADAAHFILQAEARENRTLTFHRGRTAARERKRHVKLAAVQASAIEILENRNLERSG